MKIQYILLYLSMFFWIFPAVRQYKTELFWYFLVYAFTDPITLIVLRAFNINMYPLLNFLLISSILWPFTNKKSIKILIAVVLLLSLFSFFGGRFFANIIQISIHVIITFFFIKRTFMYTANSGKVNIFHLFLLLEEISIVLKLLAVLVSLKTGTVYLTVTLAFEILIAIFFTIYREDNPKLHIDLRNA